VTIQELGSIGELVAAVATVATLGYLALQIRQNTESARIAAELEIGKQNADFHSRMNAQPELLRIWDEAAEDSTSLSLDDRRRFVWLAAEIFLMYEGHYASYQRGYISEDAWHAKMSALQGLLENPLVEEWWRVRMGPVSDSFYEYIESLRSRQLGTTWSHQSIGGMASKPE
jgi:hypothetical protein